MSAPDELFCWEGDWGLPSVDPDCLVLLVRRSAVTPGPPPAAGGPQDSDRQPLTPPGQPSVWAALAVELKSAWVPNDEEEEKEEEEVLLSKGNV